MTKLFSSLVFLTAGLLAVSMLVSCGGDNDTVTDEPIPVNFVKAIPLSGEIASNGTITVVFDNAPTDVKVNPGTVKVGGKKAIITGPFPPGALRLIITWADGTLDLSYTVTGPD